MDTNQPIDAPTGSATDTGERGGGLKGWISWIVILSFFGGLIAGTSLMFKERWDQALQFWLLGTVAGVVAGISLVRTRKPVNGPRAPQGQGSRPAGSTYRATRLYNHVFLWMNVVIAAQCLSGLILPVDRKLSCVSIFGSVFAMLFVAMVIYCVRSKHWMGALAFLILLLLVLNALGTGWFGWPFLPSSIGIMWLVRIVMVAVVLAAAAMLPVYKSNQGLYKSTHIARAYLGIVIGIVGFAVTWLI